MSNEESPVSELGAAAQVAQEQWGSATAVERSRIVSRLASVLDAHREALVELMIEEVHKPRLEAEAEVTRSVDILRYHAQQALDPVGDVLPGSAPGAFLFTQRFPVGVVGLITPWNFPLAIPIWKAAPALAHGNSVLLKPSTAAVKCALKLAELFNTVLPPHLFTVIAGGAQKAQEVIDVADVISFTGSEIVGRSVIERATARGIGVQAELSGVNAAIVLADADFEAAAASIAHSAMAFAGQKCTATSRIILVGKGANALDLISAKVDDLRFGDPLDPATIVGPLISAAAADHAARHLNIAVAEGGVVTTTQKPVPSNSNWFAPVIIDGIPRESPLHLEEIFAPLATVVRVETLDEAISEVNRSSQTLVTSVYTRSLADSLIALNGIKAGLVRVNSPTTFIDFHGPFGGEGRSGYGLKEQGKAAVNFYTKLRTMTVHS